MLNTKIKCIMKNFTLKDRTLNFNYRPKCFRTFHDYPHNQIIVPVFVLLFVALWFILRGDLFYVLSCVTSILFLCFSVLLALRLSRLGKRELILVLCVRLFNLRLFSFACSLFFLALRKQAYSNILKNIPTKK